MFFLISRVCCQLLRAILIDGSFLKYWLDDQVMEFDLENLAAGAEIITAYLTRQLKKPVSTIVA